MLWLLGVLGAIPAIDIAVALVNRAVTRGVGASRLPGLALRDGVPAGAAHAGRHARDAELARRGRRAPASPRDPLPRLPRRPAAFRAAVGLGRMPTTEHIADRRCVARHRRARHRAAEPPLRPGRGRRTFPAAASPARVVRERTALDGLGAQARQAAGTQPPAARRHRHHVRHEHRRDLPGCPTACATCSRSMPTRALPRETPRRLIGKMAHPLNRPRFDAKLGRVVEGYAILQPRVAFSLPVSSRRRRSSACSPAPPASIRTPPRCPTSTRTC